MPPACEQLQLVISCSWTLARIAAYSKVVKGEPVCSTPPNALGAAQVCNAPTEIAARTPSALAPCTAAAVPSAPLSPRPHGPERTCHSAACAPWARLQRMAARLMHQPPAMHRTLGTAASRLKLPSGTRGSISIRLGSDVNQLQLSSCRLCKHVPKTNLTAPSRSCRCRQPPGWTCRHQCPRPTPACNTRRIAHRSALSPPELSSCWASTSRYAGDQCMGQLASTGKSALLKRILAVMHLHACCSMQHPTVLIAPGYVA